MSNKIKLKGRFTEEFKTFNSYKRNKMKLDKWELEYLREASGIEYEEEIQVFKRLSARDEKHGTFLASYYAEFLMLWYWNSVGDPEWRRSMRQSRDRDIYTKKIRTSLIEDFESLAAEDENFSIDASFNSTKGLNELEKDSNVISAVSRRGQYDLLDYQPVNSLFRGWEDAVIRMIDNERYTKQSYPRDETTGIIYLPGRKTRFGYEAESKGRWIATRFSTNYVFREIFYEKSEAIRYLKKIDKMLQTLVRYDEITY